jgi:hypothetical protein
MLGATSGAWMLIVLLQSPSQPKEAHQWNMRYKADTAEQCEVYAKQTWVRYNQHYAGMMTPWMQTFTTTCSAESHHHEYRWFIKCDQYNNCDTHKYKGKRR